jgi:hypothetical protein
VVKKAATVTSMNVGKDGDDSATEDDDAHIQLSSTLKTETSYFKSEVTELPTKKRKLDDGDKGEADKDAAIGNHVSDAGVRKEKKKRPKNHACTEPGCGKYFGSSALVTHFRAHTGENPFVCAESGCGKAFSQKSGLTTHFRTHTGVKPFVCAESGCGKAFAQSSSLKAHVISHTDEKALVCAE